MSKSFDDCQVSIEVPIAWGEMDAFQHVNNVVYFRYFESARIAYFERVGVFELMEASGVGPILATTSCRFKAPLTYPDTVTVAACVESLESDRFTMRYFVKSAKSGRVAAEGEGLVVFYDYNNNCKHAIPTDIYEAITKVDVLQ